MAKSIDTPIQFEPRYLMRVNAPGVTGEISHGDMVLISRDGVPKAGDIVCAHRRDGTSVLMQMECELYEPDWRRMPFEDHPASEVRSAIVGTVVGGTDRAAIPLEKLIAIHRCEGKYEPEQATA